VTRLIGSLCGAALVAAGLVMAAPASAAPPQCGDGPIVMAGCTAPGDCTAVIDNQCVDVAPPLLPGQPPIRVGIEGSVGVGGA
jgi:hypothetical protein